MNIVQELKRRNVFRVGAAYLVVSWLLIQIVGTLTPMLELPDIVGRVAVLFLIVGFPIALIIAWAFEMTPDGIKPSKAVNPEESITHETGQKLKNIVITGLALVLVLVVLDAYVLNTVTDENSAEELASLVVTPTDNQTEELNALNAIPLKSVAVLSFADLSPEGDQEYFADGLSEELLNRLARIQDLLVAGRTSSFYFKGRNENMQEIGQQLGVAHILEGSIRKSGNQVRISAQLLKADDGFQLWSDTYDRNLEDIFSIQDEIAEAVTTALSVTLAAGEFNRPGMTTNVQAYEAYLQADSSMNPEPELNFQIINQLENAVTIDSDFGVAWSALYRAYEFATISLPPDQSAEYIQLAASALERAQQLMPDSPDYLVSSAMSQRRMGNFEVAEQQFLAALAPYGNSDGQANLNYAELLWSVGRVNDAMPYLQRAKRLDPKNVDIAARLTGTLLALGQVEAARTEVLRGISANPQNGFIRSMEGMVYMEEGNVELAMEGFADSPYGSPADIVRIALEKYLAGDQAGGIEEIRSFAENNVFSPVTATFIGPIAARFGDYELALSIHAGSANSNINDVFGSFPIWQNSMSGMRQLGGFKEMAADSGLVAYWRSTGQWGDFCRPLLDSDDFECF